MGMLSCDLISRAQARSFPQGRVPSHFGKFQRRAQSPILVASTVKMNEFRMPNANANDFLLLCLIYIVFIIMFLFNKIGAKDKHYDFMVCTLRFLSKLEFK